MSTPLYIHINKISTQYQEIVVHLNDATIHSGLLDHDEQTSSAVELLEAAYSVLPQKYNSVLEDIQSVIENLS